MEKKGRFYFFWNEQKNRWDMSLVRTGRFVMDFPDCENVHWFFSKPNKNTLNEYDITIKKVKDESD